MSTQRLKIPRVSDRTVAVFFQNLAKTFTATPGHVSAFGFASFGGIPFQEEPSGEWKALLEHDSCLIESAHCTVPGLNITYARGGQYEPEKRSAIFDEILLSQNPNQPIENVKRFEILAFINRTLLPFDPARVVGTALSPEQSQVLAVHQATLERLEQLNEDLIRQSSQFREVLEVKFESRSSALTDETRKKQEELETSFKQKSDQLTAQETELQARLKAIDDRDNTHARRDIRERMLKDVQSRIGSFGVSRSTAKKRVPVAFGIALLVIAFVVLLGWTGSELYTLNQEHEHAIREAAQFADAAVPKPPLDTIALDTSLRIWLWIRFTLFSLGLVATILYYVKWENRWAERHSESEFELQQFYIDVNRANWVVESCLEWIKETGSTVPPDLLASITRGLFTKGTSDFEQAVHPADALASALLGTASKVRLRVGDNDIEFDKPGKIAKKAGTDGGK